MTRRAAGVATALVVVAGLIGGLSALGGRAGAEDPAMGPAPGVATGGGSAPILSVTLEGGFAPPDVLFGRLPTVYVTADGRMIAAGPQILIYPGPALPNLRQQQLTPAGVAALRGLAVAAGLDRRPPDYGLPSVADVPTTVFTYVDAEGRTFVHRVEALGFDEGLSTAQQAARAALQRLLQQLAEPDGSLGAGNVGPDEPFVPGAFRIRAVPAPDGPTDDGIEPQVLPWPVDSVRLAQPATCTPVTGPDATVLRDALAGANQLTRWTQDGTTYLVDTRTVLPGEVVCA